MWTKDLLWTHNFWRGHVDSRKFSISLSPIPLELREEPFCARFADSKTLQTLLPDFKEENELMAKAKFGEYLLDVSQSTVKLQDVKVELVVGGFNVSFLTLYCKNIQKILSAIELNYKQKYLKVTISTRRTNLRL
jgi:hypothetical protein